MEKEAQSQVHEYLFFYGHSKKDKYGFLSNFALFSFTDKEGTTYHSVEQYMHYKKAVLFEDTEIAEQIMSANTPYKTKMLGRKVKNFNYEIWSSYKIKIVKKGIQLKFNQNTDINKKLLETFPKIMVEAAPKDSIWGIGMSVEVANDNVDKWGKNLLGKILTHVRNKLVKEAAEVST